MASAVDSRLAYARLSAVATASRLPTANRGSNNSYTTSWDTTMLTPDDVHHHRAHSVLEQRERTLQAAWALHPERFVHGTPKPAPLPEAVWINPPATSTTGETSQ